MNRLIDKTINQYLKYIKKTKKETLPTELAYILRDFIERKQKALDIDDHMMWLNVQNMFENIKNGIEFDTLENNILSKSLYSEKKIVINEKFRNISLEDQDIYCYIKTIKSELQHQFDYIEDKDANVIKRGVLEIKDGKIVDKYNALNDILNELKVIEISENTLLKDENVKNLNDTFELTRKITNMWEVSLGITDKELISISNYSNKQFCKKLQELNCEFFKIINEENQQKFECLRKTMLQLIYLNDVESINKEKEIFQDLFEYNYSFCMKVLKNRVYNYINSKKNICTAELSVFFDKLLANRCALRDIFNKTMKEYSKTGYISVNYEKSKEIKKSEKDINLMIERIFNLKNDNRAMRKYNSEENTKNKTIVANYIINSQDDEKKNKSLVEAIGIDTRSFIKYNINSVEVAIVENSMVIDRRLKYRVIIAIKSRRMFEKIKNIFKINEKVLMLSDGTNDNSIDLKEKIENMI